MTSRDGILAGDELGVTGQDYLSELRAWLRAYPDDVLVRDELRLLLRFLRLAMTPARHRSTSALVDGGVLAGGCTVGAGLSGVSSASVAALLALAAMAASARTLGVALAGR